MNIRELIEDIRFDNAGRFGGTPNNIEIGYRGIRVMMRPSVFLSLAAPLEDERSQSIEKLSQVISKGEEGIGNPTLYITVPDEWREGDTSTPGQTSGHEGRHRMLVIQRLRNKEGSDPDAPVEVHILLSSPHYEWRNKHFNKEVISSLNNGVRSEMGDKTVRRLFTDVLGESATAGGTSAGSIAAVPNPHISPGPARGKKSYIGSPGKSGTKAPPQPKVLQPKNPNGTAKGAHEIKGASLFGGPPVKR